MPKSYLEGSWDFVTRVTKKVAVLVTPVGYYLPMGEETLPSKAWLEL